MSKPTKPKIYQLKITLNDIRPRIWRRILVPGEFTLLQLHDVLQVVMGWTNSHLHQFTISGEDYGYPEDDIFGELGIKDETHCKINNMIPKEGFRFSYTYDFGDNWQHTVTVEKFLPANKGIRYPTCLKGKRACPPEDVGGHWGYGTFLEAVNDPTHPEHEEYLTWIGEKFDPNEFDLDAVNARLKQFDYRNWIAKTPETTLLKAGAPGELFSLLDPKRLEILLSGEVNSTAKSLPLRRDTVSMLTYLRDNKVTGTQSTGNFPLKAVRGISSLFVSPPILETTVGKYTWRFRSEDDVWEVYFVHTLAVVSGLIQGGRSRLWRLTEAGDSFLSASETIQVWILHTAWWTQTDWMIAYHFLAFEEELLNDFKSSALEMLLDIPAEQRISFEPFADQLIQESGLYWPIEDQDSARSTLRTAVKRMVVQQLEEFGVLSAEYETEMLGKSKVKKLKSFMITPFGQALLKTLK